MCPRRKSHAALLAGQLQSLVCLIFPAATAASALLHSPGLGPCVSLLAPSVCFALYSGELKCLSQGGGWFVAALRAAELTLTRWNSGNEIAFESNYSTALHVSLVWFVSPPQITTELEFSGVIIIKYSPVLPKCLENL